MTFHAASFAVFLPIVFLLYYAVPHRFRWAFLLAVSYVFYMNLHVGYGLLLLFSTVLTYALARRLAGAEDAAKKRVCLLCGVLPLVFILLAYKTANPLILRINGMIAAGRLSMQPLALSLFLPAGVSFYFFQSMGYLIDVYRGKIKAERHFGYYALFVSFFPQLLAGPIGRAESLIPQYKKERNFDYDKAAYGLKLMLWGYFKKLVIADVFAKTVDSVYDHAQSYVGLAFLVATVMFAFEIYCDFSGYSDIAIGCAKLFGIELMANFKSPYLSCSMREFWSRWHISLSTWFRDYVYIPLGGSRASAIRHCLNLILTFLVSGFWHGSSLTYLAWGAIHGLLQIPEALYLRKKGRGADGRKRRLWMLPVTFALLCFTWIFFRADTLSDALWILSKLFWDIERPMSYLQTGIQCLGISWVSAVGMGLSLFVLFLYDAASLKCDVILAFSKQRCFIRWPVYVLFLVVIALFSPKNVVTEFIYSQF